MRHAEVTGRSLELQVALEEGMEVPEIEIDEEQAVELDTTLCPIILTVGNVSPYPMQAALLTLCVLRLTVPLCWTCQVPKRQHQRASCA